jgi:hypothetical protein
MLGCNAIGPKSIGYAVAHPAYPVATPAYNTSFLIYCPMAKLMWSVISCMFGITKPASMDDLFGPWLRSFTNKQRDLLQIGVAVFCWALWISRNELVFQGSKYKYILQVIFRGMF